jgi:hypothetical protein
MLKKINEAIQSGYKFLQKSITDNQFNSELGFDKHFKEHYSLKDSRNLIKYKFNLDLGFDMDQEVFSSMIGLGLMNDESFVDLSNSWKDNSYNNRYRFFQENNGFAADTDCTAVSAVSLYKAKLISNEKLFDICRELIKSIPSANQINENIDLVKNVPMVYWEDGLEINTLSRGCKQDAGVIANILLALEFAYAEGFSEGKEIKQAAKIYLESFLKSEDFINGTRYYSPNIVLYYASYLCEKSSDYSDLKNLIKKRLVDTVPQNILEQAVQLIIFDKIGEESINYKLNINDILENQNSFGGWAAAPFYSLGRKKLYFGSEALTTMFVIKALSHYQ